MSRDSFSQRLPERTGLKIVFFGAGGEMALHPLREIHRSHELVLAVVAVPSRRVGVFRQHRPPADKALTSWLSQHGVPTVLMTSPSSTAVRRAVQRAKPDLICISTFPWILDQAWLEIAGIAAVNIHASLLPRHRGVNPYFWTYYCNDDTVGVTAHIATARVDAGPIIAQDAWRLVRGQSVGVLHGEMAGRAATVLGVALERLARGDRSFTPQDESRSTLAPHPPTATPMIPFDEWDVERVWHFLAGLYPHYREPLRHRGVPIEYHGVSKFTEGACNAEPGSVTPYGGDWELHCVGGVVHLRGGYRT